MVIFNNDQIKKLRTVYFDKHTRFYKYRYHIYYSVIYENENGMNVMEGLFTLQEVLYEKSRIRRLNSECRINIEQEDSLCMCVLQ